MNQEPLDPRLQAAIAEHLTPRPPKPDPASVQRKQLFERVRRGSAGLDFSFVNLGDTAAAAATDPVELHQLRPEARQRVRGDAVRPVAARRSQGLGAEGT